MIAVREINLNQLSSADTSSTTKVIPEFSAFQELFVNLRQFVQLFENFIGLYPDAKVFATLINFVSDRYHDLEPDKTDKLLQVRTDTFYFSCYLNNTLVNFVSDCYQDLETDKTDKLLQVRTDKFYFSCYLNNTLFNRSATNKMSHLKVRTDEFYIQFYLVHNII